MKNKFNRAINHLTATSNYENVIEAIQAVEDLFEPQWLNEAGDHRLKILWARRDNISTSELYSLGKSILKLSKDNRKWLESNAKEIKKNHVSSHGILTEMITIGSLSTEGGVIMPCASSYPVYDYFVNFETGYRIKVSVKNFDITIHEKEFHKNCEIIRKTLVNILARKKITGKVTILLHRIMTRELMERICCVIAFNMDEYGYYELNDGSGVIQFTEFSEYDKNDLLSPSNSLNVIAKQHFNEQRNIIDKISLANKKMLNDPEDEKSLKHLVIRVGATTNIDMMYKHLNDIASDDMLCGFDMFYIFQPTVACDLEKNSTMISTSVHYGSKKFYREPTNIKDKLENSAVIKNEFGVGSVSLSKAPLVLVVNDQVTNIDLSDYYVFQKGDIYLKAKKVGDGFEGDLSKIAPGVMTHSVVNGAIISPICFSPDDRLLIV